MCKMNPQYEIKEQEDGPGDIFGQLGSQGHQSVTGILRDLDLK